MELAGKRPVRTKADYRRRLVEATILGLILLSLLAARAWGYLLFHSLAELYSICIGFTYFVLAWHTRRYNDAPPIVALGIVYFFVAILDAFHALSYVGTGVFVGYSFPANQLWIQARLLEALGLLLFTKVGRLEGRRLVTLLASCSLFTLASLASVFVLRNFPAAFVEGRGQTTFKVAMEIAIISILLLAIPLLRRGRASFSDATYRNLFLSMCLTVLSELCFTLYISNYDWLNMAGHYLKIVSFYLVYRSIIAAGLEHPQELLYRQINDKNRDLRIANERKDTFISILSHDLRSPLWGIQGIATDMAKELQDSEEPDVSQRLDMIARTAKASLVLVEDVLAWARCQSGNLQPEIGRIDGDAVARCQVELLSGNAREKGIDLELDGDKGAIVLADQNMLAAILRNLLQNALKFTPPRGRIDVLVKRKGTEAVFEIRDTGRGMSDEEVAELGRGRVRLRKLGTAGERGTGFGLTLVSEFSSQIGGKLEVESQEASGSTFRLRLPLAI